MKIKKFEFNMFPVNCYVLSDETKEAVIIDAGCFYEEEKQALKRYIDSNSLTVKHLLNTHLHLDHIFGNPFLLQEYGLKAEANQADEFWLEQAPAQSRMFGFQLPEAPSIPVMETRPLWEQKKRTTLFSDKIKLKIQLIYYYHENRFISRPTYRYTGRRPSRYVGKDWRKEP